MNALPQMFENSIGAREAAKMLGVSVQTVKNYVYAGEIPHMRIGTRILFLPSVLDEWRRSRIVESSRPCVAARKEKRH